MKAGYQCNRADYIFFYSVGTSTVPVPTIQMSEN